MSAVINEFRRVSVGLLGLVAILGLVLFSTMSVDAATIVADEDFNNDLEAFGPGNGTSPLNLNGPPTGDAGIPGRWVPNGYAHTPHATLASDTNPNLGAANLGGIEAAPFIPSPHAVKAAFGSDHMGYPRSESFTSASQGGILSFTDGAGTPIVANTGDKIVGEFQFWLEGASFQFALVSDITTLKNEQAAHSWDANTGISAGDTPINAAGGPIDMPSAQTGGDYYEGIGGLITHKPGSNNETHAVIDNGAGQVAPTKLDDDIAKSFGAGDPPNANEAWQMISFEYTVGSDFWDKLSVTKYLDTPNTTVTTEELRVLSDGSAVPFSAAGTAPSSIEAIVFGAGDGGTVRWFLDEVHIEVTPIPEPGSLLMLLLGFAPLCFARKRR